MALSSRTGADRELQQRIGYDAFAELTTNERYLRVCDVRDDFLAFGAPDSVLPSAADSASSAIRPLTRTTLIGQGQP
jgi:hypothetical protein